MLQLVPNKGLNFIFNSHTNVNIVPTICRQHYHKEKVYNTITID
jgi:hypothetical protein